MPDVIHYVLYCTKMVTKHKLENKKSLKPCKTFIKKNNTKTESHKIHTDVYQYCSVSNTTFIDDNHVNFETKFVGIVAETQTQ